VKRARGNGTTREDVYIVRRTAVEKHGNPAPVRLSLQQERRLLFSCFDVCCAPHLFPWYRVGNSGEEKEKREDQASEQEGICRGKK